MIIALASPRIATSLDEGLDRIRRLLADASARGAGIVCFPEAYLPGLRGQDFEVPPFDQAQQERALHTVAQWARTYEVATILGKERLTEAGRQIAAFVIDSSGEIQGYQTKNQLDPTEERFYVPGNTRRLFEINGVRFGIAICHEGWRYPETVRWAAMRGARIVFHPQHTGSDREGVRLTEWGSPGGPYYEKAMMLRAMENTIYFASVNYAMRFQESATSLIAPSGQCRAYLPYGQEGVLVQAINVEEATGLLATRYAPDRYKETEDESRFTPEGWHTVTPRIVAHDAEKLVESLRGVFGATGEYRTDRPSVLTIGDSMIMVSGAGIRPPMPAFLYVYTEDPDGTYRRAVQAGAKSLEEPSDTPYGDRRAMVRDEWGNTWQIATRRAR